ncbi:hypothetical protein [Ensifer adhaerens]
MQSAATFSVAARDDVAPSKRPAKVNTMIFFMGPSLSKGCGFSAWEQGSCFKRAAAYEVSLAATCVQSQQHVPAPAMLVSATIW